ncbi:MULTISPECIES: MFS transporter [Acidiphilium]|uniref:MFS transporter, YNFM family, putative membrane transport protein n=1 Tax=Acidiphilium rubrum TaxID=526 RepID=A0A8G2CN51_ACIRU|nr:MULTISPECIES: MFS transporter [Acidiphilium]SIR37486.1 MFS transporter, YNFM family, putative membrane transport protein [Acidiphilium rubrum]
MSETGGYIERGSAAFRRTNLAMFAAGFATFALMYSVQPLLPVFARDFVVSPMVASLALSLTTFTLAGSLLIASALSEVWGRKRMMAGSILGAAVLTMVSAAIPHWGGFLLMRAAIGVVLSGLPAVAMGYLAEEIHPRSVGLAMGLFVGGSGFGGMAGRLLTGILADALGWRWAIVGIGAIGLVAGIIFVIRLPPSRHFERRSLAIGSLLRSYRAHLADPALRLLYAEGFLIMGGFVTVYNYITFRLLAPPFSLSQTSVGFIFAVYLVGVASSAWMGHLASRFGRARMLPAGIAIELLGALLTLSGSVPVIVLGIALVTFGFFASHSVASSWVGAQARGARAQAAALYLFLYYLGSSVAGSIGGYAWSFAGWGGVVGMIVILLVTGLALARRLATLPFRAAEII